MMRRRTWLVLGVGVLFAVGVVVTFTHTRQFKKWKNPPVLVLPADEEVAEMRASLREFQGISRAVPSFVVPAEHVPHILGWLRPGDYTPGGWEPRPEDEMGEIVIRTINGREMRLVFFWTGQNPVIFTPDGEDMFFGHEVGDFTDGGLRLCHAIEEAYKSSRR